MNEAELAVLDAELDELELVDVFGGVGLWMVVEGEGGEVLVVCGVIGGGVEEVEVGLYVLYQQNIKNNVKRNTHNGQRRRRWGGGVKVLPSTGGGFTMPSPLPLPLPLSSFSDFKLGGRHLELKKGESNQSKETCSQYQ